MFCKWVDIPDRKLKVSSLVRNDPATVSLQRQKVAFDRGLVRGQNIIDQLLSAGAGGLQLSECQT